MNSYNKILGALVLLLLSLPARAQRLDDSWALKINFGSLHVGNLDLQDRVWRKDIPLIDGISINLVKETERGNSHEWGISHIQFGQKPSSRDQFGNVSKGNAFEGGLRYQYTWNFLKGPQPKTFEPYLGLGAFVSTRYSSTSYSIQPPSSNSPVSISNDTWGISAGVEIVPGLKWNIDKRFFLDFSLPIQNIPYQHISTRNKRQGLFTGRDGYTNSFSSLLSMGFRVGLGIRLGK